jgi:hypothetical protein
VTRWKLCLVVIAAAALLLVSSGPASASQLTVAMRGTVQDGGLSCGNGTMTGTATGVHGAESTFGTVSATFSYCDDLIVVGSASGTITVAGHTCNFTWLRLGGAVLVNASGCHTGGTAFLQLTPVGAFTGVGFFGAQRAADHEHSARLGAHVQTGRPWGAQP